MQHGGATVFRRRNLQEGGTDFDLIMKCCVSYWRVALI